MNEWAIVALRQKGIEITKSGKFRLTFADGKVQEVANIEAAIRQQKHIMEQQKSEQIENERNGLIVITGSSSIISEYWAEKGVKKL